MFLAGIGAVAIDKLQVKNSVGSSELPPLVTALINGEVAFRPHGGGHSTRPNRPTLMEFAARYFKNEVNNR
jgi:hypothetical protein